jgi:radical SAM protein with 4Fe4S-binding SPASM domain
MPVSLSLELTNMCNLFCTECVTGNNSLKRSKGYISWNLFKKNIDELNPFLLNLLLFFQGEPFLHPRLIEMISYATKRRVFTTISTNGQFLTKKKAKELVESGLDKIIISMDGATQDVYEKYRIGGDLQKVLDGIRNIQFWKKTLKKSNPVIVLQCLIFKHNQHQVELVKKMGIDLKVEIIEFKSAQMYNIQSKESQLPDIQKYSRYQKDKSGKIGIKSNFPNHCFRLWNTCVITWEGNVVPCCFDKEGDFSFGNVTKTPFKKVWKSLQAKAFRKKIIQNRKQFSICRNCTEGLYRENKN